MVRPHPMTPQGSRCTAHDTLSRRHPTHHGFGGEGESVWPSAARGRTGESWARPRRVPPVWTPTRCPFEVERSLESPVSSRLRLASVPIPVWAEPAPMLPSRMSTRVPRVGWSHRPNRGVTPGGPAPSLGEDTPSPPATSRGGSGSLRFHVKRRHGRGDVPMGSAAARRPTSSSPPFHVKQLVPIQRSLLPSPVESHHVCTRTAAKEEPGGCRCHRPESGTPSTPMAMDPRWRRETSETLTT